MVKTCNGCGAPEGETGLWDRHGVWHDWDAMEKMSGDYGDSLFNFYGTDLGLPYDRLVTITITTNAFDECWCQRCQNMDKWYAHSPVTAAFYQTDEGQRVIEKHKGIPDLRSRIEDAAKQHDWDRVGILQREWEAIA